MIIIYNESNTAKNNYIITNKYLKMDYKLSELSDCIFAYLATIPDTPQSLSDILKSITGKSGHRCSAMETNHKREFLDACDTLNNTYNNVHKFFRDGSFYLMYSDQSESLIQTAFNDKSINNLDSTFDDFGVEIMVDYFFNSKNNSSSNPYTDYVKQYLSKCTVTQARGIFDKYDFAPDEPLFGTSLLDMSIHNNNGPLIAYLTKVKYENKITELRAANLIFKKNNTLLTIKNKNLETVNKKLKKELRNTSYFRWFPIGALAMVIVALVGYNFT